MGRLEQAIEIAARGHDGQVDKAGEPYILHLMRVAICCISPVVGILHDYLEDVDPDATFDFIDPDSTFPILTPYESTALDLLTRKPGQTYAEYIEGIATSGNEIAISVKLEDLYDHLADPDVLTTSLINRYHAAIRVLLAID